MTTYAGGLRARLIHDNLYNMVNAALVQLGWTVQTDAHELTTVLSAQIDDDQTALKPNIVVITPEDVVELSAEMGSDLTNNTWDFYVDVYGEDDAICLHLATDIRDILNGKMTSIPRRGYSVEVYDLTKTAATPIPLFSVEIENIHMQRSRLKEKPWQKHWRVIHFEVIDTYASDLD